MTQRVRTIGSIFGRRPDPATIEGHPMIVGTGRVGLEIELEGLRDSRGFRSPYWTVKGDGSLRNNGLEFVFSGPYGGVDLHNATVELDSFLFDKHPDGGRRCSTHAHLDVRNMTVKQLRLFILGYVVYEKFLFRMSGIHRYNNNFCPAIGFAQHQLEVLGQAFSHTNDNDCINHIVGNWDKYSAMNFLPVAQFGSVEFRISEAKWRKGLLIRLCNRFLALQELSMNWTGTEREFVDYLATAEPRDIMGQGLPKKLPCEYHDDLQVGHKLAHDLLSFAANPRAPTRPSSASLDDMLRSVEGRFQPGAAFSGTVRPNTRPRTPRSWAPFGYMGRGPAITMTNDNWHRVCVLAARKQLTLPYEVPEAFSCEDMNTLFQHAKYEGELITSIIDGDTLRDYRDWVENSPPEMPSEDPFV